MDDFADALITLCNGVYTTVAAMLSPVALFVLVSAGALAWIARLEIAQLDRRAAKPEVGRH